MIFFKRMFSTKISLVIFLKGLYLDNKIEYEYFTLNVLNLGISPQKLLDIVLNHYLAIGSKVINKNFVKGIVVSKTKGIALDILSKDENFIKTSRLLLDSIGNASPIT